MLHGRYPVLLLQRLIVKSLKNAFVVQWVLKAGYLSFKFSYAFKIQKWGGDNKLLTQLMFFYYGMMLEKTVEREK